MRRQNSNSPSPIRLTDRYSKGSLTSRKDHFRNQTIAAGIGGAGGTHSIGMLNDDNQKSYQDLMSQKTSLAPTSYRDYLRMHENNSGADLLKNSTESL